MKGLLAAAAAVVDAHAAPPTPEALLQREDAIEALGEAVEREREKSRTRVARLRARRKETTSDG